MHPSAQAMLLMITTTFALPRTAIASRTTDKLLEASRHGANLTTHIRLTIDKDDSLSARLAVVPAVRRRISRVVDMYRLVAHVEEGAVARAPGSVSDAEGIVSGLDEWTRSFAPGGSVQGVAADVLDRVLFVLVCPGAGARVDDATPAVIEGVEKLRPFVDAVVACSFPALVWFAE